MPTGPVNFTDTFSNPSASSARFRILVVDDSANHAKVFAMMLEFIGHQARCSNNGEGALALLDAYDPEVVISDISMHGMNGLELARHIRAHPSGGKITLVAHSGHTDDKHREEAIKAGFDHYLPKPAEPKDLQELLARIAADRTPG